MRVDLDGRVRADAGHIRGADPRPRCLGCRLRRDRIDRGRARHRLRPLPSRPRQRRLREPNFTTDASVVDGNGHGTHVASTIAGTGAGSGGAYRGVAPGAKLMVGKVLADEGFGEDSWVLAGMQWAVTRGADVVSMSLGGDPGDGTDPLSRAIDELSASSDTLFVVAAGNSGNEPMTVTNPGAADAALTVGAVDDADQMAFFSSRGPRLTDGALKPDVVAPGVGITAARAAGTSLGAPVDDLYTSLEGTSMATPHVAGLAAILKDAHPQWDGERLKAAITSTTVPVADATGFDAGSGRVDAERAVAATVLASASLNLGYYTWPQTDLPTTRTKLTYTNTGGAAATLALSLASQDGAAAAPAGVSLSASTLTIPAGGEASIDVLLDPSLPGTGSFSGVVIASGPTGTVARTAFGFGLESEHHDLTVQLKPRSGTQERDARDRACRSRRQLLRPARRHGQRHPVDHLARATRDVQRRRDQLRARRRRRRGGRAHLRPGGRRPLDGDDHARR